MAEAKTKERVLEAVRELPDDATIEDAMERLYFTCAWGRPSTPERDAGPSRVKPSRTAYLAPVSVLGQARPARS